MGIDFGMTSFAQTMFNVCGTLGAMVGSILITITIPIIGKRYASVIMAIIAFVSYIVMSQSRVMWLVFLMRSLIGITIGCCATICPTYVCELAPEHSRGLYGYLNQLLTAIGFMLPSCFGFQDSWRLSAALCCIPAGLWLILTFFIPDSPSDAVKAEKVPFAELWAYKKELLISLGLMFFLQFSGMQAIISNLQPIIEGANLGVDARIIAVLANLAQVLTTIAAAFAVDRFGRKMCWMISSVGQLVAFILLAAYGFANTSPAVFITGLFAEQLFYGIGTGPIPFLRTAELFNDRVRALAMAIMTAINWVIVVIVVFVWPYMNEGMGMGGAFAFYAGIQVLSIIFGIFAFPRGKQPVELDITP